MRGSKPMDALRTLPERAFRLRARLIAVGLCAVCFAGLIGRLFWLQLCTGGWYTQRALGQQLRDTVVPADRGKIYSADGALLAANSSCWTLRASPREMPEDKLALAAKRLAEILELDEAKLLEKFSDRRSNDCLLRYRVERETADAVRNFCAENGITGVRINQDSKRWYPQGEFLASVLGFTNVDNAGVSGLELEYNDTLTGQNGVVLTAVNAWGYTLAQSYETELAPVEGCGLRLTIDANIQHYLENALNYAVQEHHVAARSVGIVMEVNTGAVLAMATTPAYDPNQPRILYDEAARAAVDALSGEQRTAALQLAQQTQWRNKAVSDLYEPGSVFKLITCAAALDAGAITRRSTFYCGDSISVAGTRFHCANHKRHGSQTVTQALENSCNQSFIQIGARLGKQAFCDYFAAFGLREPTGIDLPGEKRGLIPNATFYDKAYHGSWNGLTIISISIGQGEVNLTPLQIANLGATIANRGFYYAPHVVRKVKGELLDTLYTRRHYTMASKKAYNYVVAGMRSSALKGTCKMLARYDFEPCGKTGTAQNRGHDHSVFMGFAPMNNPRIAIAVYVENGGWGADFGVPIGGLMMEQYIKGKLSPASEALAAQMQARRIAYGSSSR